MSEYKDERMQEKLLCLKHNTSVGTSKGQVPVEHLEYTLMVLYENFRKYLNKGPH